jgi:hypothetical protein
MKIATLAMFTRISELYIIYKFEPMRINNNDIYT